MRIESSLGMRSRLNDAARDKIWVDSNLGNVEQIRVLCRSSGGALRAANRNFDDSKSFECAHAVE